MMAATLVPATGADASAIAALHALAFPPEERWGENIFAAQLVLPGVFGFRTSDGVVLARVAADEAEILTLAVIPSARRAGLGRALLQAAEACAAANGARTMFLEVAPGNTAARTLYKSAGYAEVGRRPRYYPDGADALVLAHALSPGAATTS
ncbi:MAG TPA: GNAT family N-acetyltransferase [Candidatus Sulfotelmatobacter sp.]|nr:GNAT family N-acetyltransferase [Candidatus Sulfotelmatobacter sp.]